MADIRVGISGWTYPAWRGDFYPKGLAHRRELSYAAERLTSIEINGSFYALQKPESYTKWRSETPEDFVFAIKGGRYITHMKRLLDARDGHRQLLWPAGTLALGPKLGPILWQLPPTLQFESQRLADFFDGLPRTTQAAADLASTARRQTHRRPSVRPDREGRADSLRGGSAARQLRDRRSRGPDARALHRFCRRRHSRQVSPASPLLLPILSMCGCTGDKELYASGVQPTKLWDKWSKRFRDWMDEGLDVYVYFDNDMKGFAPAQRNVLVGATALTDRLSCRWDVEGFRMNTRTEEIPR